MKYLIAGLGNIGTEYAFTRHNIGFEVVNKLAEELGGEWKQDRLAYYCEVKYKGRTLHLIKPTTYMNLSGKAVNYWMTQLKITKENLMVVTDDLALPYGKLRMRAKGSDGGHNGLKDINATLGGHDYPRLRFGVGDDFPKGRQVEYVLSKWSEGEAAELPIHLDRACDGIKAFTTIGIARAMNACNTN